jgi:cation transport ATPase
VALGARILASEGISLDGAAEEQARGLTTTGETVVPVAVDGKVAGLLAIADTVRPESKDAIERLKRLGVKETVLSWA